MTRKLITAARLGCALVMGAGAVAGCGNATHLLRLPAPRPVRAAAAATPVAVIPVAASRVSTAGPYRWLIRTQGAQPTVAAENRNPGTKAWRLPGPAAEVGGVASGSVTGYVSREAVRVGETERIYVSARGARTVRIEIFRMGWYGGRGGREVLVSHRLPVDPQPPCTHRFATGLTECAWHPTLSFVIPSTLSSGVYIAKLSTRSGERDCLFVVLAARPQPLLAQLPTATYEAYNAWGGDSLYPGGADRVAVTGTTQGVAVSYQRPYDSITGAGQFFSRDVAMVQFLERYRYPVSYTTSESVDEDPGQLAGHRALIDFGHSEYWSARQAAGFEHARNSGTSLLFFGSDTMAWRIRFAPATRAASDPGAPDRTIIAYKQFVQRDRDPGRPSGVFPDRGATLTGSAYLGCITPRLAQPGPPAYRYYAWYPQSPLRPAWLFAHAGMSPTTVIPGIVGYELDVRTALSPRATEVIGGGPALCMASERGEPIPGLGQDLVQTTLYTTHSGALVFNAGTLGWELGLEPVPSASPEAPARPNPHLVAITRNLIARVLGTQTR